MSRYALKPPEGDFSNPNGGFNQVPNPGVAIVYGQQEQQQQPPMMAQYNNSMMNVPQAYVPQQPYIPSHYIVDGVYNGGSGGSGVPNNTATIIQYSFDQNANNNGAKAHDWNTNPNGGCCTIL